MRWLVAACLLVGACEAAPALPDVHAADAGTTRTRDTALLDALRDAPLDDVAAPDASTVPELDPWLCGPPLGARRHANGDLSFRVHAPNATRIEVALFRAAYGEPESLRVPLDGDGAGAFSLRISADQLRDAGLGGDPFYGLRVWGPNWPYVEEWEPGSGQGRVSDVDAAGNRMNPNKLVLDPYALEVSHDPVHAGHSDYGVFRTDAAHVNVDSGPFAPKGIVVECAASSGGPARPLRDEVIYEVHLRGLTMNDPSVPLEERGTYAGAARRAPWLRALGVTAIEFLPLHETPNDQNDLSADANGDNYWGYSSLSFFAPDRRLSRDQSPGGPSRELRAMIEAFHSEGIKVYVDVVYNHTAEGGASGDAATILSWRGLDNAGFYELSADAQDYVNSNGVGPNLGTAEPLAASMVLASLHYWHEQLGADGFRFDLAPVVANGCARGCYRFDTRFPSEIASELARAADGGEGVDLIAEPWGAVGEAYQLGRFPSGWAEWNDRYRDAVRADLNRLGFEAVTVRELLRRVSGSPDLVGDDGRPPSASINFVVAHDGMTLYDLFHYDDRNNHRAWPYGPSDGGTDRDLAWGHAGDPLRQSAAQRTALALLMISAGVPMITGGDESGRSLRGNNNPYNLDSVANWLHWPGDPEYDAELVAFTGRIMAFRHAHASLRPRSHWQVFGDADGDGLTEVRWFRDDGRFVDDAYQDADDRHFIGWQLDGDELGDGAASLFFAYNGWSDAVVATLPAPPPGHVWRRVLDTSPAGSSFGWVQENESAGALQSGTYLVAPRSVIGLVALPD